MEPVGVCIMDEKTSQPLPGRRPDSSGRGPNGFDAAVTFWLPGDLRRRMTAQNHKMNWSEYFRSKALEAVEILEVE